jgi:hypothetical protein
VTTRRRGDTEDTNGATSTTDTGRLSRPKNRTNKPSLETSEQFDIFWKIYPLKVAKKTAIVAFEKALQSASAEEILSGAKRYAGDPNRHPSFTAHPTTWLHQERWGDDPLPPREFTSEEKKAIELAKAKEKAERDREETQRWFEEQERQKAKAVPAPKGIRDLLRK